MNFADEFKKKDHLYKMLLGLIRSADLGIKYVDVFISSESDHFRGLAFRFTDHNERCMFDEDKRFLYELILRALNDIQTHFIAAVERIVEDDMKAECGNLIRRQEKKIEEAKELISDARRRLNSHKEDQCS